MIFHNLKDSVKISLLAICSTQWASPDTHAQNNENSDNDATTLETVSVVGSRIKRTDIETSQPVLVLERAELQNSGIASVGDILQKIPAAGSTLNTLVNNGGNGSSNIDLRNLGPQRVLILLNGRRWAVDLDGTTDLNTIPLSIIERIEILKDGASSIYGSDAIAGVVNITTRDRYEGAEANAYLGETADGDGRQQAYDFTLGTASEKASVVVNVSYVQQDPIFARNRDISRVPVFGTPGNNILTGASSVTPAGSFTVPGRSESLTLIPGRSGSHVEDFRPFDKKTEGYNFTPTNYLATPQQRTGLYIQGRYAITDNISFQSEVLFNRRESNQHIAAVPLQLDTSGVFGGTYTRSAIHESSIYNPFGVAIPRIQRRIVETGPRVTSQTVDTYAFRGGFEGSFDLVDRNWGWDIGYNYSKNISTDKNSNLVNLAAVQNAVGPSFIDASGTPRCGTTNAIIADCVPLNLLGGAGSINPEMLKYITYSGVGETVNKRINYTANINTNLFELPAGPLGFAAGYEYRKDSGSNQPDPFVITGQSSTNRSKPTSGQYALNEFYAEFNIPVLKDMPAAQLLEFSLAARYSDYSNFGSTSNAKFGFRWKPMEDLLVRGNYSQGFRAPSIAELYQGQYDNYPQLTDPCSSTALADNPKNQARCAALGVPGNYQQISSQIRSTGGGNPNLKPEQATTRTLGLVYSPGYVPGLDLYLDWYDIRINHIIAKLEEDFILDSCVNQGAFCSLITRAPTGDIIDFVALPQNQGTYRQQGYDFVATYQFDTDMGKLKFTWDNAYLTKYSQQNVTGIAPDGSLEYRTIEVPGSYLGRFAAYWRFRSNLTANWTYQNWGASATARYYSPLQESCNRLKGSGYESLCSRPLNGSAITTESHPFQGVALLNKIPSRWYLDLQAHWDSPWNARLAAGVQNVLNKDPPVSYSTFANSFDPAYPLPGRFWYVQYRQKF